MAPSVKSDYQLFVEAMAARCHGRKAWDPVKDPEPLTIAFQSTLAKLARDATDRILSEGRAKPGFMRIITGVIDDEGIDAVVFPGENVHCIGLSWGVYCQLMDIFRRLALRAEFLPGIGDPTPDHPPSDLEAAPISRERCYLLIERSRNQPPSNPRDPVRVRLMQELAAGSTVAIFSHEAHHILMGHFGYRKATRNLAIYEEFTMERTASNEERLVTQLFETEADENAVISVLLHFLEPDGSPRKGLMASNSREALLMAMISIDTLFRIRADNVAPASDWTDYRHPPLFVRRMLAGLTAEKFLTRHKLPELARLLGEGGIVAQVLDVSEDLTSSFFGEKSNRVIWKQNSENIRRYLNTLHEIKKELHPRREEWAPVRLSSY
jgi:hypothetical protein